MSTFTRQIPRSVAAQLGREAVEIANTGQYLAPSDQNVMIRELLDRAVTATVSYPPDAIMLTSKQGESKTLIEVENETTLSAGKRLVDAGLNPVLLNFASATSPGGGFLHGARAQEEYLARSSGLHACLRSSPMYEFHHAHYDPLYSDYMIYSPDVPVFRDDDGNLLEQPYNVSIITCAAVNASKMPFQRRDEIVPAMAQRIRKVLGLGVAHHHDSIVLGAWGCGAFGNDGHAIAQLFSAGLREHFKGAYQRVIFAIVDWSPDRTFIGPFENVFKAQTG